MYSNDLICKIIRYIDDNINNKITIEDLENIFFYNRFYIMKLFKKEMNLTIIDYINSLRIYNSIIQIRDTENKIINISFKCGFYSIEYFSEIFKKCVGVNPRILKNYYKNKNSINLNQINTINNSLLNLFFIKQYKDNYLSNQKPTILPVKKLTIFK